MNLILNRQLINYIRNVYNETNNRNENICKLFFENKNVIAFFFEKLFNFNFVIILISF